MAETATAANNSTSPDDNAPPPCRSANAITSAAPASDAIQNSGRGRSWVMTTATRAVAIGMMPNTRPPCEASTVCTCERHQERKQHGDAQHRDHELRPQRARRQRPAQHQQQRQRAQAGDYGTQRRSAPSDRSPIPRSASPAMCRRRSPCRQSPAADRGVRVKIEVRGRSWRDGLTALRLSVQQSTRCTWRPCAAISEQCRSTPGRART